MYLRQVIAIHNRVSRQNQKNPGQKALVLLSLLLSLNVMTGLNPGEKSIPLLNLAFGTLVNRIFWLLKVI